ncbi:sensor histidine kinase [Arcobacter sp. HD9-500m-PIT-SAG03]|nr:sensor histidine kinase [Arcobacter sp. HD9-500m-PIT-SAG03]
MQDSYKKSLNNQYKSFLKNLKLNYSNLTVHLQNQDIYTYIKSKQSNKLNRQLNLVLATLQKQDMHLKKIRILKKSKDLLELNTLSIIERDNSLYFRLIYPLLENDSQFTAVEFLVDTKKLLQEIKSFNNSDGVITFTNKHEEIIENTLNTVQYHPNFQKLIKICKEEQKGLFALNSKFYVTKSFSFDSINKAQKVIFFLDVTKEKLAYKAVIKSSVITSVLLFIFAAIAINFFFEFLIKRINKNEKKLKEINKNLEQTIDNEITYRLKIQKKAQDEKEQNEQLLIQQSKLAMMGEMIGNIAHQWRQPLMQLSAIIMYMDAHDEKGKLTKEKFQNKIKESDSIIDYMSKTIEDFRNYYQPEKQKESFYIKESIESALFIIDSALKNSFISTNVVFENEDIKIISFKNEFSQALLNIISNAKDVLIQRKIKNPTIHINVKTIDGKVQIRIEDNAEGIKEEILDNIFDPYFTTKHKSQGTGIGLYMTKMIIENNMNGNIEVENTEKGALFTIIL